MAVIIFPHDRTAEGETFCLQRNIQHKISFPFTAHDLVVSPQTLSPTSMLSVNNILLVFQIFYSPKIINQITYKLDFDIGAAVSS